MCSVSSKHGACALIVWVVVQLLNCGLSDVTIKALEGRGILALFPIQKHVYEPAAAGKVFGPKQQQSSASHSC